MKKIFLLFYNYIARIYYVYICKNQIVAPLNRNIIIRLSGKNNVIKINSEINKNCKIRIKIYGDNNVITIDKACIFNLRIQLGYRDNRRTCNSKFFWGKSLLNSLSAFLLEDNTSISVGDDCMVSSGIELRCTDDHSVLDLENNVINKASDITIGNHVWIGKDVLVLKNSTIPDNCIVGAKAVVAKRFAETNCAICGNPANVVKKDINWNDACPDWYKKPDNEQAAIKF